MAKHTSAVRMHDHELALIAAAIFMAGENSFIGSEDATTNELRIERLYEDIFAIGERRLGSEEFAALRDEMITRIRGVI